jgi:hypothetical protein
MTLNEMIELQYGTILHHKTACNCDGTPMRFKVNGAPQAFKRNLNNARLPVKRGLWEYGYITASNVADFEVA